MLKEEIKNIDQSNSALKKFGITIGGVLLIIGLILLYYNSASYLAFLIAGGILLTAGLLLPIILKPFNIVWMMIAIVLGFIMTRVILSILFYFVITPIGFLARIFGKEFLQPGFQKNGKTYWEKRTIRTDTKQNFERQF